MVRLFGFLEVRLKENGMGMQLAPDRATATDLRGIGRDYWS